MTPVKYEWDLKNVTVARSKILLTEKLTNGTLVTPTPVRMLLAVYLDSHCTRLLHSPSLMDARLSLDLRLTNILPDSVQVTANAGLSGAFGIHYFLCADANYDGSNFVMICQWVLVIMVPSHQAPTWSVCYSLVIICFVSFRFVCCFVCPPEYLSRALFFGWTCFSCEVGIKFNLCVILAHNDNIWLDLSIYQVVNIPGYVFCSFRSRVWIFLNLKFDLVCRYPRDTCHEFSY